MRKIVLILIICSPVFAGLKWYDDPKTRTTTSSIDITVLSNFGKQFFQYDFGGNCYSLNETRETRIIHPFPVQLCIIIPVKEFRCENKHAYNDLLKLLKAEEYPFLEIDIPDNTDIKYDATDSVLIKGVSFTVAGVTKQYDIHCQIVKDDNGYQILNGSTKIKLTDLKITPPVKLFGFVKVNNEIKIDFGFCLKSSG